MLPDNMSRDVSGFGTGTTLHVKSVGTVTLQDVAEGAPMTYNAIDTNTVPLSIGNYVGDAWGISDELRQDGSQIDALHAMRGQESIRALQESFETQFLSVANAAQTADGPNNINGFAHRFIGSGTNLTLAESDLIQMSLAFNKANAPMAGRIGIVDPVVAATLDKLVTVTTAADARNDIFGAWSHSFVQNHRFVMNWHGWQLFTSNRLPRLTAATTSVAQGDGTAANAAIGDIANIFMCIADDGCKPIMRAWRKMPSVEGWRANEEREDRFQNTAKYGLGAQRVDTLGVILTSDTATE